MTVSEEHPMNALKVFNGLHETKLDELYFVVSRSICKDFKMQWVDLMKESVVLPPSMKQQKWNQDRFEQFVIDSDIK
jgi:hypothetical protein